MFISSFSVLLPVFFVIGLGYWAGRTKKFDSDQIMGLNELVLTYALPAVLFVATVTTTRSQMIAEAPFLLALVIGFLGLFIAVVLVSRLLLHHTLGAAALQACATTIPSVAFFGIPIFKGLFGEGGVLSIASANVLVCLTTVPLTIVLLEIHKQQSSTAGALELPSLIGRGLANSFVKPMVWAPLLGILLVLLDIDPPKVVDDMFALIGSTTSGASLFLAGLLIAAYEIKFDAQIIANVFVKMVGQPLLIMVCVLALGIANPLAREAILIGAIPTSVFGSILAPRYKVYEAESASTMVLTALVMLVSFPLTILLTGGA
jgi:predicted permease